MNNTTFNKQYQFASSKTAELLDEMAVWLWAKGLSSGDLFEALCERLEERVNLEESEIKTLLCEIASRLPEE